MKHRWLLLPLLLSAMGACSNPAVSEDGRAVPDFEAKARAAQGAQDPLDQFRPPLPARFESARYPGSAERVELGKMLYFEARLSKNHDVSCNSCHSLEAYGADARPTSLGHKKQAGSRNSPSVYNAAGHFVQFWDGRADAVETQATGPILNPVEMAVPSAELVVQTLTSMPEYVDAFKKAFPSDAEPITLENVGVAIGAFERELVTPSPWDKYLEGDRTALTAAQKAGLDTFLETGCATCHTGTLLGGERFQKAGLARLWPSQKDQGRFDLTKAEDDRMMFKVPSLRNIAHTAPYFHDGSVATLEQAVTMMAQHQLGKDISAADVTSIVTFLGSLSGSLPADKIEKPRLPKSTPATPKPDPT